MEDKRYTEDELAEYWQVSTRTLQKWRAEGVGPRFITIGKNTVRYREADVLAYEEAGAANDNKQEPTIED